MIKENNIDMNDETRLKYAHLAAETWKRLGEIPRTGWVMHGVKNPETVQEHTISLLLLVDTIDGFTDEERDGLREILEVHDWAESITGDRVVLNDGSNTTGSYEERKACKYTEEKEAMHNICKEMNDADRKEILAFWERCEDEQSHDDKTGSLARELDKYQAIEKALEYDMTQGTEMFQEFFNYSQNNSNKQKKDITHPVLLERLRQLQIRWSEYVKK